MALFSEFTGGRIKGKGIEVKIVGMKRLYTYIDKKLIKNLPRQTNATTDGIANDIIAYARANINARAKYVDVNWAYKASITGLDSKRGTLASSINILSNVDTVERKDIRIGIEPTSPAMRYAYNIEYGQAGGQRINNRYGKKMKFYKGGETIFADKVTRGSYPGMYYMRDAVIKAAEEARERYNRLTSQAIQK